MPATATTQIAHVYTGSAHGAVLYVGITTQKPVRRFQHHKCNGRNLDFKTVASLPMEDARELEASLIEKHRPLLNKRGVSKPFSHVTEDQSKSRIGNKEWCQVCLRRRVSSGYTSCLWCHRKHGKD